ncbi:DUF6438 domain-containing protein [Sphingomonas floccifaciens]|uniref:DUF6438 domain-containing protein n=1 Tax=Sphingomonas floccifaciens TaxID=1844115 RepID=A0ABW4NBH4_9SPHN
MLRVLLPLTLLAGCAPAVGRYPATPSPTPIEITYETGPCYGTCPVYSVRIDSLGRAGVFDGKRFVAAPGRHEFAVTFAQFDAVLRAVSGAFAASSADYTVGGRHCGEYVTDRPSITVTIREGNAEPKSVRYDLGCRDPQNATLAASLRSVPSLLPIGHLIGPDSATPSRR